MVERVTSISNDEVSRSSRLEGSYIIIHIPYKFFCLLNSDGRNAFQDKLSPSICQVGYYIAKLPIDSVESRGLYIPLSIEKFRSFEPETRKFSLSGNCTQLLRARRVRVHV